MPNGMYGGVRGKETKVGQKTFVSRPTRLEVDAHREKLKIKYNIIEICDYAIKVLNLRSVRP